MIFAWSAGVLSKKSMAHHFCLLILIASLNLQEAFWNEDTCFHSDRDASAAPREVTIWAVVMVVALPLQLLQI